ncbi:MAG: helix-turn-helix transcriptional regulator [Gammaproteobacteria bacterium]|nr:helix-turn-helix transcriptional regulator [Gammaproteobacteria bacterium]
MRDTEDPALSVRRVAARTNMSVHHFIRLYKAVFGETPHQCRVGARLERAKYLLTVSDLSITDVCMAVGFSSLGSFSHLFSSRVGLSPSAYRRKFRPLVRVPGRLPPELAPGCFSLMS